MEFPVRIFSKPPDVTIPSFDMDFKEYKYLVFSDLYRLDRETGTRALLRQLVRGKQIYQYNFWMRTCRFTRHHRFLKYLVYPVSKFMLTRYRYKFLISIPYDTEIGSGFYIGHFGSVFVHSHCKVGKNFNISQNVSVGVSSRGAKQGCPVIGDNVYIGPGAKIFGAIKIGNNVAIGANCVVTKDVPDDAVVCGVPGKVISSDGAAGYIRYVDYDRILREPHQQDF